MSEQQQPTHFTLEEAKALCVNAEAARPGLGALVEAIDRYLVADERGDIDPLDELEPATARLITAAVKARLRGDLAVKGD